MPRPQLAPLVRLSLVPQRRHHRRRACLRPACRLRPPPSPSPPSTERPDSSLVSLESSLSYPHGLVIVLLSLFPGLDHIQLLWSHFGPPYALLPAVQWHSSSTASSSNLHVQFTTSNMVGAQSASASLAWPGLAWPRIESNRASGRDVIAIAIVVLTVVVVDRMKNQ